MKTKRLALHWACAAASLLVSGAGLAQSATSAYSAVLLSQFSGITSLNDSGQVAGRDLSLSSFAYSDANGVGLHTIITPNGFATGDGSLTTINNQGLIAGFYESSDPTLFHLTGFYTDVSGRAITTGANGQPLPTILALNDHGKMVAVDDLVTPTTSLLSTNGGATWQPISALNNGGANAPGGSITRLAININNNGQLLGIEGDATVGSRMQFIANADGSNVQMPSLPAGVTEDATGLIKVLNNNGQFFGNYIDANGNHVVYLAGPNGVGLTTISGLNGAALGINDSGQLVGTNVNADGSNYAVVTQANGQNPIDLNTLVSLPGESLSSAILINGKGQVVAATDSGKYYLLSPVPDAPTGVLMLLGMGSLAFVRRKA